MREILFRAKRIDRGEWIEGYYCKWKQIRRYLGSVKEKVVDCIITWMSDGGMSRYEIDPETLCQYTGLKTKNGNRIWENDIVICNRREKEAKYKVVWDKTYADFRIEKLNGLGCMPICIEEGNTPVFGRHYECIGNVFDNPELLKKQ